MSVLYHALQGGWMYDKYIEDAEREADQELARFFRGVRGGGLEVRSKGQGVARPTVAPPETGTLERLRDNGA